MNNRLQKFISWMKNSLVDAAFISSPDNIFYLTGFRCEPHERLLGLVVFQDSDPFLVCPEMEVREAKKSGWNYDILGYKDTDDPWDLTEKKIIIHKRKIEQWGIEKNHINVAKYEELQQRFPSAHYISADEALIELRLLKDTNEIESLRKACKLADYGVEIGVNEIAEGTTELGLIAAIEYELKKKGVSSMSFGTLVLTGANAASPHGVPGDNPIKKGDFILFDLGVVYEGYCSDITRTIAFGDISKEQEKIYQTVQSAQEAAVNKVKPGIPAKELDQTAREIIKQAGYGDYFTHRLGHGLGISVHEYPSITDKNELELIPGMVFTIEPGIYIPDAAGVRIEDDVLVTKDGAEVMTRYTKDLIVIE